MHLYTIHALQFVRNATVASDRSRHGRLALISWQTANKIEHLHWTASGEKKQHVDDDNFNCGRACAQIFVLHKSRCVRNSLSPVRLSECQGWILSMGLSCFGFMVFREWFEWFCLVLMSYLYVKFKIRMSRTVEALTEYNKYLNVRTIEYTRNDWLHDS